MNVWPLVLGGGKFIVYQLQLVCEDGNHICATSYSEDLKKVQVDWERTVKENICKMKEEK